MFKIHRRNFIKVVNSSPAIEMASHKLSIKDLWRARRATALTMADKEENINSLEEEIRKLKGGWLRFG